MSKIGWNDRESNFSGASGVKGVWGQVLKVIWGQVSHFAKNQNHRFIGEAPADPGL